MTLLERVNTLDLREKNPLIETIESMIGQHGHKQGGWTMYYCPFHEDGSKRSFGVNPEGSIWKCFGDCGTQGDVIQFVANYKRITFLEAVEQLDGKPMVDDAEREAWRAKRAEDERQEKARQESAQARFQAAGSWETLHKHLGPSQRSWWQGQGIPDSWQDYWCLGWLSDLWGYGPAYSIPFFDTPGQCKALQYRLERVDDAGKYRFEPDLAPAPFIARPEWGLKVPVILTEGAKKAAVTHILGTNAKMQVAGTPSKNSDGGICEQLKESERVFILLDPDAWYKPKQAPDDWIPSPIKWARQIGPQASIIRFPAKIDDALLAGWLDSDGMRQLLKTKARPIASYAM